MKKNIKLFSTSLLLGCILLSSNVFALDNSTTTASTIMQDTIVPYSFIVEKPVRIIENLSFSITGGWVVTSRNVEYETFTFINGISLDESRSYVEDIRTGLTTRKRIQHYYYTTY